MSGGERVLLVRHPRLAVGPDQLDEEAGVGLARLERDPSPCWPPLASWAKVVITYLLSDFFGLWQAMQFWTRIGATS